MSDNSSFSKTTHQFHRETADRNLSSSARSCSRLGLSLDRTAAQMMEPGEFSGVNAAFRFERFDNQSSEEIVSNLSSPTAVSTR